MSARPVEGGESSNRPALLALLALVYPALALASTWPLVTNLDGLLPLGTLDAATTSLLNVWTLWWNADRLAAGLTGYWDAPIFFPCRDTFALSEPSPLLGIAASPLFLFGASPVRNTNLVLLAMLALNGWMTFILLRRLGLHQAAAALAGACVVVLPYSHREIAVLHLVPLSGVLGTLWAGIGWIERPTIGRAILLGVALEAAYLISSGHALFVALAGAPAFAWLLRRSHLRPRALLGLAVAALLCAGLVAPVVGAQLEAERLYGMKRPPGVALAGAALPRDWWASPWPAVLPIPGGQEPRRLDRLGLYPGSAKLALALMGVGVGLRQRRRRRWTGFAVILLAVSLLLSMLPSLAGGAFFDPLRDLPGFGQIRSFYRAGLLVQLAVVILAALCLDALLVRARARPRLARTTRAVAILLGVLAVADLWPRQQRFAEAPSLEAWAPWTSWVRANVGTREAMLHLPMPGPGRMRRFEADARWMVLQTAHGRLLVNGYSSFMPREIQRVARATTRFPESWVHHTLARLGVRWIVARPSWLRTVAPRGLDPALWRPAYEDDPLDVAVYEVVFRPGEARDPAAPRR